MPAIRTIVSLHRCNLLGARKTASKLPQQSQLTAPLLLSQQTIEISDEEDGNDTEDDVAAEDVKRHSSAVTHSPASDMTDKESRDKTLSRLHKKYVQASQNLAAIQHKLKITEERLEKSIGLEQDLIGALLICAMCREPFVKPLVLSNCGHTFCLNCLFQGWLQQQETQLKRYSFLSLSSKCMVDFSCATCQTVVTKRPIPNWQIRGIIDGLQSAGVVPSADVVTETSTMDDIHELLGTGSLMYDD